MPQRTALIAGATGLVGSLCLKQLLDDPAYAQVFSISRRPASESHPKLVQKLVDFDNLSQLAPIAANDAFCAWAPQMPKPVPGKPIAKSTSAIRKPSRNLLWQEARNNSHWCRRWAQTLVRGLFISARKANSKKQSQRCPSIPFTSFSLAS